MKKTVLILLCVILLVCSLTGCSSKTPVTAELFVETMEASGFTTADVTAETETNGLATAVIVAIADGEKYQIEFYQLTDSNTAEAVFRNNKQIFDNEHHTKTLSTELSANNYNYCGFNADGNFHMIARVDSTMLYCEADKAYKDEIVSLVEQLGYK